jgi:hypothetical protein
LAHLKIASKSHYPHPPIFEYLKSSFSRLPSYSYFCYAVSIIKSGKVPPMFVMKLVSTKYITCPTTNFPVPTKSIAVVDNEERNSLEKLPIWWYCLCCDEWHLLGFYPSVINKIPHNGLETFGLTKAFH